MLSDYGCFAKEKSRVRRVYTQMSDHYGISVELKLKDFKFDQEEYMKELEKERSRRNEESVLVIQEESKELLKNEV